MAGHADRERHHLVSRLGGRARDGLPGRGSEPTPPRIRILLGAPERRVYICRVRSAPETERLAIRRDHADLDARRPEVDTDEGRAHHAAASSARASTACAVRTSVT